MDYRATIRCIDTGEIHEFRFTLASPGDAGKHVIKVLRDQVESTGLDWVSDELEEIRELPKTTWLQRLVTWWRER